MRQDNIADPEDPSDSGNDSCSDICGTGDCREHEAGEF